MSALIEGAIVIPEFFKSGMSFELLEELRNLQYALTEGMTPQALHKSLETINLIMGEGKSSEHYQQENVVSPSRLESVDLLITEEGFSHHELRTAEGTLMATVALHRAASRE